MATASSPLPPAAKGSQLQSSTITHTTVTIPKPPVVWWKHFVAGNLGGLFGLSLAYPLDTVKVRMQTRPAGTYTGIVNCMVTMSKQEGVLSLYRGLLSPLIGYGLIKAAAFGAYNQAKDFISTTKSSSSSTTVNPPLLELMLCGAYAGFVQTFVRAPVEQIKVVMQARNKNFLINSNTPNNINTTTRLAPPYSSTYACLKDVIKTEGIRVGLFRSFTPTLAREIPQYAIYYPSYEVSRLFFVRKFTPNQRVEELSPLWTAIAGGIAGVAQWAPTYSLDVIKSKVSAAPPGTYKNFWDCVIKSYRAEGIPVFFRGISAALIRAFPLHGAVFLGYEMAIKLIG